MLSSRGHKCHLCGMKYTALILSFLVAAASTFAQAPDVSSTTSASPYTRATFVYHPESGTVLENNNGDMLAGPASLTKLMTLYLTFEALKEGRITAETPVNVSEKAWRTEGSKMFIEVGKPVPVDMLVKGIAIVSGNDACVAIAEHIGGTEEGFAQMMNTKAKQIGMTHTTFVNASGMPDPAQRTTAHDMAMLLTAIFRDFPEYKHYLAQEEFVWNNIKQQNRNGLLRAGVGIDAGKTGHTAESGYHLASTAEQNGDRLVVVVMGTNGFSEREGESLRAYRTYFATYHNAQLFRPGDILAENVPVWHGKAGVVNLTVAQPVKAYLNRTNPGNVKASISYNKPLVAPLNADTPVG
ncbi:MAG: D-alanyl-D-alanine carboxypeptidase, partial [Alphaproteobacteria bacterium]